MLSLMPLLPFALCVGYAFSLMHLVAAASDAPLGYEDGEGFHFGIDPEYVRKE